MKGKYRKNIIKMLILALGVTAFLGMTVTASATGTATATARDLVGRGTAITARTGGSSGATADAGAGTGAAQSGSQAETTQVEAANTGIVDQLYPFITMLALNFVLFAVFMHLRLNQSRYGRSQTHYKEIDDFHWRMQHLND